MRVFQRSAFEWALDIFGPVVRGARYQAFRLLEEALELGQALGLTREDALRTVDWVFGRPPGSVLVEIGDVRLSLDILAETQGIDCAHAYGACCLRVSELDPVKMRAKDQEKIAAGLI